MDDTTSAQDRSQPDVHQEAKDASTGKVACPKCNKFLHPKSLRKHTDSKICKKQQEIKKKPLSDQVSLFENNAMLQLYKW